MKVLFVCMGNICRSPAAENVMRKMVTEEGLENEVVIDSAGTIGMHLGNPPDARMTKAANARGISSQGRARQVRANDLEEFDLILAMDRENLADLIQLAKTPEQRARVRLFCEFCTEHGHEEVPDPYYGGADGFELVLDLLEDGCAEILRQVQAGKISG